MTTVTGFGLPKGFSNWSLELTASSEVLLGNKQVRLINEMINIISDPLGS